MEKLSHALPYNMDLFSSRISILPCHVTVKLTSCMIIFMAHESSSWDCHLLQVAKATLDYPFALTFPFNSAL